MAWLTVPNEWWSVNETYSKEPSGPGGQEWSEGYHNLTLDPLLTDEQRQPSKIRITYSVSASVTGTDTYDLSADYSLSATGMTSINESSDASSVVSASDTIERDLTLVDFFYSISLSVFAEAYGSDCYATAGSAVISSVEFYYEEGPLPGDCCLTKVTGLTQVTRTVERTRQVWVEPPPNTQPPPVYVPPVYVPPSEVDLSWYYTRAENIINPDSIDYLGEWWLYVDGISFP